MLAEVLNALKDPDIREKFSNLGATPVGMPSEEFSRYLAADIDKYTKLGKRIGLKLD